MLFNKMNKLFVAVLVLMLSGCSIMIPFQYPNNFIASKMGMHNSHITWRVVEDATAECKALGSKTPALACAFMGKYNCVIVTNKDTSHEILGHEMRHCFEGNWHD
jgi:hypothetical protein